MLHQIRMASVRNPASAGKSRKVCSLAQKKAEPRGPAFVHVAFQAIAKMMDATVPSIIMIATIRLKILRPLLIRSLPHPYLPTEA